MGWKSIELDDEALAELGAHFGTVGDSATVNAALLALVLRLRRERAFADLTEMAARGEFDGLLLRRRPGGSRLGAKRGREAPPTQET